MGVDAHIMGGANDDDDARASVGLLSRRRDGRTSSSASSSSSSEWRTNVVAASRAAGGSSSAASVSSSSPFVNPRLGMMIPDNEILKEHLMEQEDVRPGVTKHAATAPEVGEMQSQNVFEDTEDEEDDDGLITEDEVLDFETKPWPWPSDTTCKDDRVVFPPKLTPTRANHWRESAFAMNFWRLPRSRNYQMFDAEAVREGFCKAGQVQVNVVAVMDDEKSCAFAKRHYDEGTKRFPLDKSAWLGRGTFMCSVLKPSEFKYTLHKGCHAHNAIELNRVPSLVHALDYINEEAARTGAKKYKYIYYVDPEEFDLKLTLHRTFSPTLNVAYGDKFRIGCRRSATIERSNNCQAGVQKSPIRPYLTRIMGGSVDAVRALAEAMDTFMNEFVPLRKPDDSYHFSINDDGIVENAVTKQPGCVCPSDEEVLSEMAHRDEYANLFAMRDADAQGKLSGASCGWVQWKSGLRSED